jgi:hypothetical protein
LSIVRFRTALKDPLDIVYHFWAIALGLTAGPRFSSWRSSAVFFWPSHGGRHGHLAVWPEKTIPSGHPISPLFRGEFSQFIPAYKVKSKTVTPQAVELVVELTLKNQDSDSWTVCSRWTAFCPHPWFDIARLLKNSKTAYGVS